MARITVEDCIDKVESPYELVLVAKERATQLNSGIEPTLDRENDKNTVLALREIAVENVKVPDLTDSAIYKLRKHVEQVEDGLDEDEEIGDDFENLYKGEISKSGTPILPSKRARKIPEKIQVSKEDMAELSTTTKPDVDVASDAEVEQEPEASAEESDVSNTKESDVSLDQIREAETDTNEVNPEDSDTTNK